MKEKSNIKNDLFSLTTIEERYLFLNQFDNSAIYNNLLKIVELNGKLDIELLRLAFRKIVNQHNQLKASFQLIDNEYVKLINDDIQVDIIYIDGHKQDIDKVINIFRKQFDLSEAPLFKIGFIKKSENNHLIVFDGHRILLDSNSIWVLINESLICYNNNLNLDPGFEYLDYSLIDNIDELQKNYWKNELSGDIHEIALPFNYNRPLTKTYDGDNLKFTLDSHIVNQIKQLSKEYEVELSTFFLSVFKIFLWKISTQEELIVGNLISRRSGEKVKDHIGIIENILAIKTNIDKTQKFQDFLSHVNEKLEKALLNQDYRFEKLIKDLNISIDISRNALFNVAFDYDSNGYIQQKIEKIDVKEYDVFQKISEYDLLLNIKECKDCIDLIFNYSTSLFSKEKIQKFINYYLNIIEMILSDNNLFLKDIKILSEEEYKKLVYEYNSTENRYNEYQLMHQMFENQVKITPHNIAVTDGENGLSYDELNKRANQLANSMVFSGVKEGDYVAVIINRSIDMIISVMAILKAGAIYIPIEPGLPKIRISTILNSLNVIYILTNYNNLDKITQLYKNISQKNSDKKIIYCLDSNQESLNREINSNDGISVIYKNDLNSKSVRNLDLKIDSGKPAYVIFTSGTTGTPKGVIVCHKTVINTLEWINRTFNINESDKLLFITSLSFDLSVYDIFGILGSGASIRLAKDNEIGEPRKILDIIIQENITIWDSAPPALQLVMPLIVDSISKIKDTKLRLVLLSGDWIPLNMPVLLKQAFQQVQVISLGGATEASIWSNYYKIEQVSEEWNSIPYGKPIQNAKYYILDDNLYPCPEDSVGELYIGGDCLALGYINDEKLTNHKFIKNPFVQSGTIYRTGDLARWREDGNIELFGRKDSQVKIRGYRIELGEIKNVINQHELIQDCLVNTFVDQNEKKMVAYLIPGSSSKNINSTITKEQLGNWETVFDATYNDDNFKNQLTSNFSGWNSSYTGEAIPIIEMEEWLQLTIQNILSLNPKHVLEIGCGTGMILFGIEPHIEKYCGSDLSGKAIQYISNVIETKNIDRSKIELFKNEALDFSDFKAKSFDTIVLNSIIQYFPGMDYFISVIKNAISITRDCGKIYIGDVRNLSLIKEFHASILFHKLEQDLSIDEFTRKLNNNMNSEKELLIAPHFFYALKDQIPEITHVEIRYKKANYSNELSMFRYDVVLHINNVNQDVSCISKNWQEDRITKELLNELFISNNNDMIHICNIPNKMLQLPITAVSLLEKEEKDRAIKELFENIDEHVKNDAIMTNDILSLVPSEFEVDFLWNSTLFSFDAVIKCEKIIKQSGAIPLPVVPIEDFAFKELKYFVNDPLQHEFKNYLIPDLKKHLNDRLPYYMVPEHFILIKQIPLTKNGKVALHTLPLPDINNFNNIKLEPPTNDTEEKLIVIWKQILQTDELGINVNFFEIGGHSLKAGIMALKINKEFNVEIPVRTIFQKNTIKELAKYILTEAEENDYIEIDNILIEKYYQLSSTQKRIFILNSMKSNNTTYNILDVTDFYGKLDQAKVEDVLKRLIQRHESLRTSFSIVDSQAVQIVHDKVELKIISIKADEKQVENLLKHFIAPFNLEQAPLFRVLLIELSPVRFLFALDIHHIIFDGTSLGVFKKEFSSLYNGEKLDDIKITYKDYIVWNDKRLASNVLIDQEEHWINKFSNDLSITSLKTDFERPAIQSFKGRSIHLNINESLAKKINQVVKKSNSTLFSTLLSVYYILLYKYTSQKDIIIGTVVSNRPHSDLEKIIGMFVNTLPLRTKINEKMTFSDFLNQVHHETLNDFGNQEYPFELLIEKIDIPKDASQNPLFTTVFVLQNMELSDFKLNDIKSGLYRCHNNTSKFDISFVINQNDNELDVEVEYSSEIFKQETMEKFTNHFINLLEQIIENTESMINDLSLMTGNEKEKLLIDFNNNGLSYNKEETFIHLFEEQVKINPDNIAVVYKNQKLTYRELNTRANQLAGLIRSKNGGIEDIIGCVFNPSLEMIVSLIAVLKNGCVFLPIDPEYPEDRITYMIQDSKTKLILTQTELLEKVKYKCEVINIMDESIYQSNGKNPDITINPDNIAYIIYTSGSTGNPKGVMVENKALVNLCMWHNHYYEIQSNDRSTKYAGFGFDATVWEIFPYLITGASIYVISPEIKLNANLLNDYFEENKISISFLPTQICEQFMEIENNSLKKLLTGGDKLKRYQKRNYTLFNNYGPTENTVVTTSCKVEKTAINIPIGKPINNVNVYILDLDNQLQPVGVPGELCIGGASLARGYLNNKVLTEEKFIDNPFKSGEKIYKTGDKARWLEDGNIEFLGRIDNQVKLRGYRIELGEIEHQLLQIKGIIDVIVVPKVDKTGNVNLCSYYVSDVKLDKSEISDQLARKLPKYMIPAYFMQVESIPLMPNGKIDKKQLPEPEIIKTGKEIDISSLNENGFILLKIWKKVFKIEEIGGNDNFFELGGDSIKAMQIMADLHNNNLKVEVTDIFESPTINKLQYSVSIINYEINQDVVEGDAKLTAIQKWFFEQNFIEKEHFNQCFILLNKDGFDNEIVKTAFNKIVEHHDALRMIYKKNDTGEFVQYNRGLENNYYKFEEVHCFENEYKIQILNKINQIHKNFSLEKGPLLSLCIFNTFDGDYLFICIHHLIIDGVSWRIIFDDFKTAYIDISSSKAINFPRKTTSFLEWSDRINDFANGTYLKNQISYWKMLENYKVKSLPREKNVQERKIKDSEHITVSLSKVETQHILKNVNKAFNTNINDILLSTLSLSLKKWADADSILINLEGHGREQLIKNVDISRTVGWFTSKYPVFIDNAKNSELSSIIKNVKETLRQIPDNGVGYEILKYLAQDEPLKNKILPEISFNYLGQFDQEANNEVFEISNLPIGGFISDEYNNPYALDINAMTIRDKIEFTVSYNKYEFRKDSIIDFMNEYIVSLKMIIEFCINKEQTEFTPSDLGTTEISLEDFNELSNDLKDILI